MFLNIVLSVMMCCCDFHKGMLLFAMTIFTLCCSSSALNSHFLHTVNGHLAILQDINGEAAKFISVLRTVYAVQYL